MPPAINSRRGDRACMTECVATSRTFKYLAFLRYRSLGVCVAKRPHTRLES